jgi:protein tyrosine phosphatase (PTP) superfamily phosphohydrolase (DUF442 family)
LICCVCLAVVGGLCWIYWKFFKTYHLAIVQPDVLYRDGVRTLRQFKMAAAKTGVRTVVSLVDDQEIGQSPFVEEMNYCAGRGIAVVRLPIVLGGWPTGDQIKEFLRVVKDASKQPVLVHCAQGVRRTGMMVAAYQRSVLNYDRDRTTGAMLTFGHSQRTVGDVQRFIDNYDPEAFSMTQTLPQSVE